jgi:hypothetical protein
MLLKDGNKIILLLGGNMKFNEMSKEMQWVVCVAIGNQHKLIDEFLAISHDLNVKMMVNGVELNFENIWKRINEEFDRQVEVRSEQIALTKEVKKRSIDGALYAIQRDVQRLMDVIDNTLQDIENGFREAE